MRAVEWTRWARADLLAIVDDISDENPDAAQSLKDDLEAKAARLPDEDGRPGVDGSCQPTRSLKLGSPARGVAAGGNPPPIGD